MLSIYFKLAFRNIVRKKLYTVINIIGLGVASAFCILVYWYMQYEKSFDSFHVNNKQLFRLEVSDVFGSEKAKDKKKFFSFLSLNPDQQNMIVTPVILAPELKKDFFEIERAVRIVKSEAVIRVNGESYKEKRNIVFTDQDFFEMFSFPLKKGNSTSVLDTNDKIVLSEKVARKYFGNEDPVGKTLTLTFDKSKLFTVSGVAEDFPANSSFQFDLLMNREADPGFKEGFEHGLNSYSDLLILQLKKEINVASFEHKLDAFGKTYFANELKQWSSFPGSKIKPANFHLSLRPFAEGHFNANPNWGHYTDVKNIFQLSLLAMVILLIACLNYILLTLTGTISRSKEVGIRKTIGGERKQIILQFYIETQLLVFLSVIAGFFLAITSLPLFSNLIDTSLLLQYFSFKNIMIAIILLSLLLGFLAGIYPALVMSGLKPLNMMHKFSIFRLNPYLSKTLGITQFSVCIILIISSLVISGQMRYVNEQKMGFDKDQVLSIQNPYGIGSDPKQIFRLKELLNQYVLSEPAIEDMTTTWFSFQGYNRNTHIINGEKISVEDMNIDYNYFSFFKIPVIKGRNFSQAIAADSAKINLNDAQHIAEGSAARQAVIVNKTLYNLLGHPSLNEINRELGARIIGVCKDYHADDFTKKIAPGYHKIEKGYLGYFWIKIKAGQNIAQVMDKIQSNWKRLTNGEPFNYTFLDEDIAKSYNAYIRWMRIITASCFLAIIIACMGLFGLSGLTTMNRIKEIGIRKVLGASVNELFLLLNKSTVTMAALSFIIAVPVAILLMNEWLQNFAYRIIPSWSLFALAGCISLLTAFIAVSYHTIKTALSNPVQSLRSE